jgi:hypothetical protein
MKKGISDRQIDLESKARKLMNKAGINSIKIGNGDGF